MKTPIAYFGGKSRWADEIAGLFPPHRVYVEPFAGSAAVLFAKRRSTHEIINDLDDGLVCFLRVLRDRPDALERVCRLTPYSRSEFEACMAWSPLDASDAFAELDRSGDDYVEKARRWWVRSSQSFARTGARSTGWSVSIVRGANNARSVWNRIERFALAAERIGGVTIERRDALEVIDRYDDRDGVIYLDPPYVGSTRTSFAGGRRPGGDYIHEFATEEQHRALAAAARSARSTVFLSGYPSSLYDELYDGWHRLDRRMIRHASNGRGRTATVTEVIWSNRPIAYTARLADIESPTLELPIGCDGA